VIRKELTEWYRSVSSNKSPVDPAPSISSDEKAAREAFAAQIPPLNAVGDGARDVALISSKSDAKSPYAAADSYFLEPDAINIAR
jgi:hypothetical protein